MPPLVTAEEGIRAEAQATEHYQLALGESGRNVAYDSDSVLLDDYQLDVVPQQIDLAASDEKDRRIQVIQHLRDLGFLGEPEKNPSDRRLAEALRAFYLESKPFDQTFELAIGEGNNIDPPAVHQGREERLSDGTTRQALWIRYRQLRRLMHLTSLDGHLRFKAMPPLATVNLATRVAQFRLRTYNLVSQPGEPNPQNSIIAQPSDPIPTEALERLRELHALLDLNSTTQAPQRPLEMLNALADPERLAGSLIESFDGQVDSAWIRIRKKQKGHRRNLGRLMRGRVRDKQPNLALKNLFALELLQIYLWMDDYYMAEVDLHWGKASLKALEQFLAQESNVSKKSIRRGLAGPTYELNAVRAIQLFRNRPAAQGDIYEKQDEVLGQLGGALQAEGISDWNGFQNRIKSRDAAQRKKQRRRYFGIGGFVRAIRRIAGSVINWVRSALKSLFGPMLKFLRFIGRGIRTAIRVASLALRYTYIFATGKPLVSGKTEPPKFVVTWHQLDADTRCFIHDGTESGQVQAHFDRLDSMQQAFYWIVNIGLQAGKLLAGAISGPIGWFLTARRIFRIVRDIMDNADTPIFRGSMLWA